MAGDSPAPSSAEQEHGPYVGLRFFTAADAQWFFGREGEGQTIIANLRGARLTVLYAPSGVGKSSLLRAGVAHDLDLLARRLKERRGTPRYVPVVFGAWKDDPVEGLIDAVQVALRPFLGGQLEEPLPRGGLENALATAVDAVDARLLVILDQFEEYLLYRERAPAEHDLVDQLAACLNDSRSRTHFLIAIRDDAYAGLGELFAGKIPNVFGNYLQLEPLDRRTARETIVRPLAHFNHLHPEEAVQAEPELIEAVLDQVRAGAVTLGSEEPSEGRNGHRPDKDEIDAPYLQLVMARLWRHERKNGSRVLRLATLQDLGGAQEIVRSHVEGSLAALDPDEHEAALELFGYLVTPSGSKIAHSASDLALMIDRPALQVADVLSKLARGDARIVRHVPPPPGHEQPDDRYELFHDVLAPAILEWRTRAREQRRAEADARERERLERERAAAERRAREEARRRGAFQRLAAVAIALFALALVLGILALIARQSAVSNQKTAQSRALAASAEAALGSDPELGTLLALQALHVQRTAEAERALRDVLAQLQLLRAMHTPSLLYTAAFDSSAGKIVTAGADDEARIWSLASGRQVGQIRVGKGLSGATFSPDGRLLLTASTETGAALWNLATGARVRTFASDTAIEAAAFNPAGTRIATGGEDGRVRIWDASTGRQLAVFGPLHGIVRTVSFSRDGQSVLAASEDGTARAWPLAPRGVALTIHVVGEGIDDAAFSPDGSRIVTAGTGDTARIWDTGSGRELVVLNGHTGTVYTASFSPDGTRVLTSSEDGTARIWAARSGRQLETLSGHLGTVRSATFAPDGATVLTASEDGTARIWDAEPRELERMLTAGATDDASFSRDGTRIATAGRDGLVRIWDVASGRQIRVLSGDRAPVSSVAFNRAGTMLVSAAEDNTARVWDARTGREVSILRSHSGPGYAFQSAVFNPEGTQVVTAAEDGTATVWSVASGQPIAVLGRESTAGPLYDAVYSPDGTKLATAAYDGTVTIWNAAYSNPLALLKAGTGVAVAVAFSPDGRRIVTADADGTARVWDWTDGRQLAVLNGHTGPVTSASFSSDGTRIVTSGADGTVRIWDARTGKQLVSLDEEAGRINSASFSPNGRSVLSAGVGMAAIWSTELDASIGVLERIAAGRVTRQLTPQERATYGLGG
jgi:WD40 repeat protein